MIEIKVNDGTGTTITIKGRTEEIINDFSNIVNALTVCMMRDVESQKARKKIAEMMYLAFKAGMEHGVKAVEQEGKA
jgi:hypothetical protein